MICEWRRDAHTQRERENLEKRPKRKVLIITEFKGKIYVCSLYHSLRFLTENVHDIGLEENKIKKNYINLPELIA